MDQTHPQYKLAILASSIREHPRVGCSTGHWSKVSRDLGAEVVGIDINLEAITQAKSMWSGIEFECISVENFLKKDSRIFDLVILTHLLEHLDDPKSILKILRGRATKLIVEVPDIESNALNFARLVMGLPYYTDEDHVREYSIQSLTNLLGETQWSVLSVIQLGGTVSVIAS